MNTLTFVLVHGAWHDAWCWHRLIPLLQAAGHQVHAPDLPGHGRNKAPLNRISLNVYSGYISQLIDNQKYKVILVGHSMAGAILSQVALSTPDKIARLVYLNAFIPGPGESIFDLMALLEKQFRQPAQIAQQLQLSADKRSCTVPMEARVPLFYQRCSAADAAAASRRFALQATLPLAGKLKSLEEQRLPPRIYIGSQEDRILPLAQQTWMLGRQKLASSCQLNSDHSPFLSSPEQLARVLLA